MACEGLAENDDYGIQSPHIILNGDRMYRKGRFLGKGGFAKCYEITDMQTMNVAAVKIIPKLTLIKQRAKQKLIQEIKIHHSLMNQKIVQFLDVFEDNENVYIVLELCENQTLNELLKVRHRLTELEIKTYVIQVIDALLYLHDQKVIHRDLKLGNLFLTSSMELKLGDFGLATKITTDQERKWTVCGTPNYIAPEILAERKGHSYEVDIWSLGVLIYAMIFGTPPFETSCVKRTYTKIKQGSYTFPEQIPASPELKGILIFQTIDLMENLLQLQPEKRPTLKSLYSHAFLRNRNTYPSLLPPITLTQPPMATYVNRYQKIANYILIDRESLRIKPKSIHTDENRKDQSLQDGNQAETEEIWVEKWIFHNHYGLGYRLSNSWKGVIFNDKTSIMGGDNESKFWYIDQIKQGSMKHYTTDSNEDFLKAKMSIWQKFVKYLSSNNVNQGSQNNGQTFENEKIAAPQDSTLQNSLPVIDRRPPNYVESFTRRKDAVLLKLSARGLQICFNDLSQLRINLLFQHGYFLSSPDATAEKFLLCTLSDEKMSTLKQKVTSMNGILRAIRSEKVKRKRIREC